MKTILIAQNDVASHRITVAADKPCSSNYTVPHKTAYRNAHDGKINNGYAASPSGN